MDARLVNQRKREVWHVANAGNRDEFFDAVRRLVVLLPRVVEKNVVGVDVAKTLEAVVRVGIVESKMLYSLAGQVFAYLRLVTKLVVAGELARNADHDRLKVG